MMLRLDQVLQGFSARHTTTYSCGSLLQPNAAMLLCRQGTVVALMALHHSDCASQGLHLSCSCYLHYQRRDA